MLNVTEGISDEIAFLWYKCAISMVDVYDYVMT